MIYIFDLEFGNDTINDSSGADVLNLNLYAMNTTPGSDFFSREEGGSNGDDLIIFVPGGGSIRLINYFDESGTMQGSGYIESINVQNIDGITIVELLSQGWI